MPAEGALPGLLCSYEPLREGAVQGAAFQALRQHICPLPLCSAHPVQLEVYGFCGHVISGLGEMLICKVAP